MERENEKTLILVYAQNISPRLQYIVKYLFEDLCGISFELTDDVDAFLFSNEKKICYAENKLSAESLHIYPIGLLSEEGVSPQNPVVSKLEGLPVFFQSNGDLPFDLFSASFYLISRYEEYLPHKKDMYGRYDHTNSIAYQHDFLHLPLVEIWINLLCERLTIKKHVSFSWQVSYDIDQAWCWKHKGVVRNAGGLLRDIMQFRFSAVVRRVHVLFFGKTDPFDSFEWMDVFHEKHGIHPLYFFLLGRKNGKYDKHILPDVPEFRSLIMKHALMAGIHPSWAAHTSDVCLSEELDTFKLLTGKEAVHSRYHYVAFNLPGGYERLIKNGVRHDYSMGYGTINGFRASTSRPFRWFDLLANQETILNVHPYCWMDANSFYQQNLNAEEAFVELNAYKNILLETSGMLMMIRHNDFLGSDPAFNGWREMYERFVREI